MKQIVLFFLAALMAVFATAQSATSTYYYADGERILLNEDRNILVLHFDSKYNDNIANIQMEGLKEVELHDAYGRALLTFEGAVEPAAFTPEAFGIPGSALFSAVHGFMLDDGFKIALTHDVVIGPSPEYELNNSMLSGLASRHGAIFQRDEYGTQVFRVDDPMQGLAFANALEEQGLVQWAHPDFYAKVTRYNDPFYTQQFQMNNTGQSVNGFSGVSNIDCNGPEAWAITTGSSSLTVAVIDDGLEAHEDLVNGSNVTRVLGGNTPATGGNGTPRFSSDAHGMACAGIISATHNNSKGVRGVAPGVNLRSVNIFWGGETTQTIANGINWARIQGADVMSNSWGYTSCNVSYSNINSALSSARTSGRGGKGCIIVFASGNGGKSCIDYPANRSEVLAVGSVTNQGQHSNYANRGSQLSMVAPSDPSPGQAGGFVRTIDRMGSAGYDSGNYTAFFGGTSAACPVVSGAAALVLSVNPDLTEVEVRSLLESTATDMGANGFDNTYGNGRVNAGAAVAAANQGVVSCEDESISLNIVLDNYPAETTWQVTSDGGAVVASGGSYSGFSSGTSVAVDICLPQGCYSFTIFDSFGDGICCQYGTGSYALSDAQGAVLASGGQFTTSEATSFCVGDAGNPTCALPYPVVTDLSFSVQATGVFLSWTGIPGSTFCRINGSLSNGNGDKTVTVNQAEMTNFFIPQSQLPLSANYRVRVLCGCQQSPEIAGNYSPYVFFFFSNSSNLAGEPVGDQPGVLFQPEAVNSSFEAFPNPSFGDVNLDLHLAKADDVTIRVYDLLGKEVFAERQHIESGNQLLKIDLQFLKPAIYLLQVLGTDGVIGAQRVVIK
jgi:subtilisin family serine protease